MTSPGLPQLSSTVAALQATVNTLDARNAALTQQLAQLETRLAAAEHALATSPKLTRHLQDHAASGYDFRAAQTASPNPRPPAAADNYPPP